VILGDKFTLLSFILDIYATWCSFGGNLVVRTGSMGCSCLDEGAYVPNSAVILLVNDIDFGRFLKGNTIVNSKFHYFLVLLE
jgi:hypothetical protein